MTSLRVSILCAAAVGYVFHSKCFAGSSRPHIPRLLVTFFLSELWGWDKNVLQTTLSSAGLPRGSGWVTGG